MGSIKPPLWDQYRGIIIVQEQINCNNYKSNDSLIDRLTNPSTK